MAINGYLTKSNLFLDNEVSDQMAWVKVNSNLPLQKIESKVVIQFLKNRVKEKYLDLISNKTDNEGFISFKDLNKIGLKIEFDQSLQKVLLKIDPSLYEVQKIYLSSKEHRRDKSQILAPDDFSGYLNIRLKENFDLQTLTTGTTGNNFGTTKLDSNFRFRNAILENILQYDELLDDTDSIFRERSRLIFDFEDLQSRLTLGDLDLISTGFQNVNNGAGISYTKAYTVNPTYFRSIFRRSSLTIKEKTFLEIFVNGQIVERLNAMPGVLDLLDYPFLNGTNNVEIAMTDSFGQRSQLFFNAAFDYRLLPVGLSEYSYNFHWARSVTDPRGDVYDINNWMFNGFYRRGLTKNFALGGNLQSMPKYNLLGSDGVYTTKDGIIEWDLAYSHNTGLNAQGFAIKSNYQTFFAKKGERSDIRYQLGVDHFSPDFKYAESTLTQSPYQWNISTSINQNYISKINAGLGLTRRWGSSSNLKDRTEFNTSIGCNLGRNFLLGVNIKANINQFDDYTAFFTLNWFENKNFQQLSSSYYPKEKVTSVNYSTQPIRGSDNLRLNTGFDQRNEDHRVSGGAEYINQRFETQLFGSTNVYSGTRTTQQSTQASIGFGTALAFAGGQFAISRPIENSFTIISLDQNLKGHNLPINKFSSFQGGEINMFGPAVINNMTPYFTNNIAVDVKSLPVGFSINEEKYTVKPGYKTGQLISVKANGEVSAKGRLIFPNGISDYINVSIISSNGKKYDFFTNMSGEFFISGLKPGVYTFLLDNYKVKEKIKITKKSIGIINLGDLNAKYK